MLSHLLLFLNSLEVILILREHFSTKTHLVLNKELDFKIKIF